MSTRELRELRNVAFVIGFGFTMGKFTANNGSKRMQELCDEYGIDYNNRSKNTTDKVIIGFHA